MVNFVYFFFSEKMSSPSVQIHVNESKETSFSSQNVPRTNSSLSPTESVIIINDDDEDSEYNSERICLSRKQKKKLARSSQQGLQFLFKK